MENSPTPTQQKTKKYQKRINALFYRAEMNSVLFRAGACKLA